MLKKNKNGAVLILVFWALGLLAVFAVYLGVGLRSRLDFLGRLETRDKLSDMSSAGIKKAVAEIENLPKDRTYVGLKDIWSNNQDSFDEVKLNEGFFTVGYNYKIDDFSQNKADDQAQEIMYGAQDACARLNINFAQPRELFSLFEQVTDIKAIEIDKIVSAVIDWRDSDNQSLPRGAEDKYYQGLTLGYNCKNAAFDVIDELLLVKGIDQGTLDKLKPYITVYGSGEVNINTASRSVLLALGLGVSLTDKIISFRCGEDAKVANPDDRCFLKRASIIAQITKEMSLTAGEVAQLSNVIAAGKITTFSDIFIIESVGRINYKSNGCRMRCVFQKELNELSKKAGTVLGWGKEYFN